MGIANPKSFSISFRSHDSGCGIIMLLRRVSIFKRQRLVQHRQFDISDVHLLRDPTCVHMERVYSRSRFHFVTCHGIAYWHQSINHVTKFSCHGHRFSHRLCEAISNTAAFSASEKFSDAFRMIVRLIYFQFGHLFLWHIIYSIF